MHRMRSSILSSAALFVLAASSLFACEDGGKRAASARIRVTSAPVTVDARPAAANAAGRLLLHLDDVRLPDGKGTALRVYVNAPAANAATGTEHAGFVEELLLVPSRSQASASPPPARKGQNFVLPLPDSVRGAGRITVTLVPVRADTKGELSVRGTTDVTLKRPYVTIAR
jgi:hypothetical protein